MSSSSQPSQTTLGKPLHGRVALVTGSTGGLGLEAARALAAAGASVLIHGRDDRARSIAATIPDANALIFNLADEASIAAAFSGIPLRQPIDVLVCNAGIRDRSTIDESDAAVFRNVLEVNLIGHWTLVRAITPFMTAERGGSIILVSSLAAHRGNVRGATYAASKAALESLARSLAVELGPRGIRANAVAPGFFATEFNAKLIGDDAGLARMTARIPLGRPGHPSEIAGPILFLASDASSYMTGQVVIVDGGAAIGSLN